jgi:hypothetical protein
MKGKVENLIIRMSKKEKDLLKEEAERQSLTLSDYVRSKLFVQIDLKLKE